MLLNHKLYGKWHILDDSGKCICGRDYTFLFQSLEFNGTNVEAFHNVCKLCLKIHNELE